MFCFFCFYFFTERERRHFPDFHNQPGVIPPYKPHGRRYIPHNEGKQDEWIPHNQSIDVEYSEWVMWQIIFFFPFIWSEYKRWVLERYVILRHVVGWVLWCFVLSYHLSTLLTFYHLYFYLCHVFCHLFLFPLDNLAWQPGKYIIMYPCSFNFQKTVCFF